MCPLQVNGMNQPKDIPQIRETRETGKPELFPRASILLNCFIQIVYIAYLYIGRESSH
jgi:hypothetical protein